MAGAREPDFGSFSSPSRTAEPDAGLVSLVRSPRESDSKAADNLSETVTEANYFSLDTERVLEIAKEFGIDDCWFRVPGVLVFDAERFIWRVEDLIQYCEHLRLGNAPETLARLETEFRRLRDGFGAIQRGPLTTRTGEKKRKRVWSRLRSLEEAFGAVKKRLRRVERFGPLCDQCQSIFNTDYLTKDPWHELTLALNADENPCSLCRQLRAWSIVWHIGKPNQTALCIGYRIRRNPYVTRRPHYILEFEAVDTQGCDHQLRLSIVALQDQTVCADEVDTAVNIPLTTWLPPQTFSRRSLQQADEWLRVCRKEHATCRALDAKPMITPTRLLFLEQTATGFKIRLRETHKLEIKPQYIALSHCWGGVLTARLTQDNYSGYLQDIPQKDLPQVFLDTFHVASHFGINYVWIDSLCIVQDSVDDWKSESAKMGTIYRHCFCNIAATGFRNGENGLFVRQQPDLLQPFGIELDEAIPINEHHASSSGHDGTIRAGQYLLVDFVTWEAGVDWAPLNSRGWVVQERLLSARTLHFGEQQLFWECHELQACEVWPNGFPKEVDFETNKVDESHHELVDDRQFPEGVFLKMGDQNGEHQCDGGISIDDDSDMDTTLSDGHLDLKPYHASPEVERVFIAGEMERITERKDRKTRELTFRGDECIWGMPYRHGFWTFVVFSFSGCNLTFPGDKLIAISGLARLIGPAMHGKYHAGMWEDNLVHQLAWQVSTKYLTTRPLIRPGPSWSWASVDGHVGMPYWDANPTMHHTIILAHVLHVSSDPVDGDCYGFVHGGRLRILASLGVFQISRPYTTNEEMEEGEDAISIFWDSNEEARRYGETKDRRLEMSHRHKTPNTVVQKLDAYGSSGQHGARDLFFMAIHMMGFSLELSHDIDLGGLLLLPTGEKRGEFRRIGSFDAYEDRFGGTPIIQMFKRLKTSTTLLDDAYFIEYDGAGQYVIEIV
ncbi:HET-domain-containing protein [Trematosphaeria pertusa]|uniref:HET-domain-containing protein n=1 Tax=Trematosphaeria pertusa TaxID=390896 RepID=A0A6A6IEW0_9PLEO|nr:HET-domain-containing protein [Trematosphaeria pertusa]KAF2248961.1 HET-domain-containing protein [Trematosphaeria pertusa]